MSSSRGSLIVVDGVGNPSRQFSDEFDEEFPVGSQEGNHAFFGRNVLRGLTDGIDDFVKQGQSRWRRHRSIGPMLLGSAMWIDDEELIQKLQQLSAACIVVTKQGRKPKDLKKLQPLAALNELTPGVPNRAFSALSGLAPRINGQPTVVGPCSPVYDGTVPTIRMIGFRRMGDQVPIVHAKLALLGHLWWHDEDAEGGVSDVIGFEGQRLWVSSANFTNRSRRSLEFGYWTEDEALVQGVQRFLVKLLRSSEGLDPQADSFNPELAPVDYDEVAMSEAWAELSWEDAYEEPDEDEDA